MVEKGPAKGRAKKTKKKATAAAGEQLALPRTAGHGGRREGAGRKPAEGRRRRVAHVTRPELGKRTPVHVTMRLLAGRPSLRAQVIRRMFERIVRQVQDESFRVVEFSLQHDHVHFICEPADQAALCRAMRRVAIRFSLRMNALFGRDVGKNWGDRYHRHDLRTPREVRNALVYVLMNAKKHGEAAAGVAFVDPFSSADGSDVFFDASPTTARACGPPRFWLTRLGWKKRWGLLSVTQAPASPLQRRRAASS